MFEGCWRNTPHAPPHHHQMKRRDTHGHIPANGEPRRLMAATQATPTQRVGSEYSTMALKQIARVQKSPQLSGVTSGRHVRKGVWWNVGGMVKGGRRRVDGGRALERLSSDARAHTHVVFLYI